MPKPMSLEELFLQSACDDAFYRVAQTLRVPIPLILERHWKRNWLVARRARS